MSKDNNYKQVYDELENEKILELINLIIQL